MSIRYEDQTIDQVLSANDIVEVISQYLPLKRSGRNFKAVCPFHPEKTPSFMVNAEKQIFHCFGCGAGGNVFSFLMRYENSSFPEVLRQLAERAGIRLPDRDMKKSEKTSETERLYEIYRHACDYYHALFLKSEEAGAARAYFLGRGFQEAEALEFKIGWAPEGWRGLFETLSKKGFDEGILLKSGLIQRSPKGPLYDTFRGRLLFPIHNLQGKVIAFGGRLIENKEGPKYLNSAENPIFRKRRELFGLYFAKKFIDRERPRILIVEGYFGFLRLYQAGLKATVATLGTSLTEEHVQILHRFVEEAIVIYDGDKAGEAASLRGLEVFLEGGLHVKLVKLPEGLDPDDFIREKGPAAFQTLVDHALDFFDFKLQVLLGRYNRKDPLGLVKITNEFLETFLKVKNSVLLDHYLRRFSGALGVEENSLRLEFAKLKKKMERGAKSEPASSAKTPSAAKSQDLNELLLFVLALEEPEFRRRLLAEFSDFEWAQPSLKVLFNLLKQADEEGLSLTWPQMLNRFDGEDLKQRLTAAYSFEWASSTERQKTFLDCLAKIKNKQLQRKLEDLRQSIACAERLGDLQKVGDYVKEYQSLLRYKK